jgi:hypothetical protein
MYLIERKNSDVYRLEKEFDRLNKEVFRGVLVRNFPLIWNKSKKVMGMVRYVTDRLTNKPKGITKFEISNFYEMTEDQFLDTMVHEMIHVYIVQYAKVNEKGHGRLFHKLMDQANKIGYHIAVTEEISNVVVDKDKKVKPLYIPVIFVKDAHGRNIKTLFALVRNLDTDTDLKVFNTRLKYNFNMSYYSLNIYKVTNPELYKHHISNNLMTVRSFFTMTGNIYKEFIEKAKPVIPEITRP